MIAGKLPAQQSGLAPTSWYAFVAVRNWFSAPPTKSASDLNALISLIHLDRLTKAELQIVWTFASVYKCDAVVGKIIPHVMSCMHIDESQLNGYICK
jgi:hypothetical protein